MQKFLLLLLFFPLLSFSQQESITVMHYNVLNYGNVTSYCTTQNNNIQDKDNALSVIIEYTNPDIFTVNEVGSSNFAQERILNNILNTNGRNYYAMGNVVNASGGTIDNMLYYDSRKFALSEQDVISTSIRDIDIYKLYFKAQDLSTTQDTAFLTCFVTHLKAGSSSSDQQLRSSMTASMMSYIENNMAPGNFLLLGDLNLKTSAEQAYQNVINYNNTAYRFYDPIATPGSWNNSSSYADIHTQSTHYSSNGCASGGGLDDRFDFIMISGHIQNQTDHFTYQNNSYAALGNDGQHFNDAINYNGNSSVPSNVLNALYTMSDHLPVMMNLIVDQQLNTNHLVNPDDIIIQNPVENTIQIDLGSASIRSINMYSLMGQLLANDQHHYSGNLEMNVSHLSKGLYILELITDGNQKIRKKIYIH